MTETGFGELLKRLRTAAGLTQEGLAERAGISAKAISDLERDPTRSPRLDSVVALAEALGQDEDGKSRLLAAARPGLAAPPPQPSTPWPARELPCPPTPLIGRAGVVRMLADLVREGRYRLVTVGGPGGVGKTRVAIEVVRRLAPEFPDGVVQVDLTPARDVPAARSTIAQALGVIDQGPMSLWEGVTAVLGDRRVLLLLDNLEQVVAAGTMLVELLAACPRLAVLATSRVPLGVRGERVCRIAPLELPPPGAGDQGGAAVVLFRERAEAAGADLPDDEETKAAIAAVCHRLDGLPLAIELAAARTPLLGPVALLTQLRRRLPLLTAGPHDLPARQQTMRDAVAWSYELLTPAEQRLFRQLCVFSGGFDHDAADAVSDHADGSLLDPLTALAHKNMLRPLAGAVGDTHRIGILETIREYGLEQLEAAGEAESTRARHATHFADVVRACGDVARDLDNIRAALSWAITTEHAAIALDIGVGMWRFWSQRGQLTEGRRWLDAVLRLPGVDTDPAFAPARTRLLVGAMTLAIDQGAFEEASTLCLLAVDAARAQQDGRSLMLALTARGFLARHRSCYADAAQAYREALVLAEELRDVAATATIWVGLSYVASISGDLDQAGTLADRANAAARDLTDARARADILQMLAWLAYHRRQPDLVDACGSEALDLYRGLGETGQMAEALRVLGTSATTYGDFKKAEALLVEAQTLHQDRGDELRVGVVAAVRSHSALNLGDLELAEALAATSLEIARRYDSPWAVAMSLLVIGHVALASERADEAFAPLADATAMMMVGTSSPLYLSWCVEGFVGVAVARGDWQRAARLCVIRDTVLAKTGSHLPPMRAAAFERDSRLAHANSVPTAAPAPPDDPVSALRQIVEEMA